MAGANKYLSLYKADPGRVMAMTPSKVTMAGFNPALQRMAELESSKSRQCLKSQLSKQMMQMHSVEEKADDKKQMKPFFSFGNKMQTAKSNPVGQ